MKTDLLYVIILVLFLICGYNSFKLYQIDKFNKEPKGTLEELLLVEYFDKEGERLIHQTEIILVTSEEELYNEHINNSDPGKGKTIAGYIDFDGNKKYLPKPISEYALNLYLAAYYQKTPEETQENKR